MRNHPKPSHGPSWGEYAVYAVLYALAMVAPYYLVGLLLELAATY